MTIFTLSEPTIFPDLNKKETKEPSHAREILQLDTLKYKHFRSALKFPEQEQMHQLMLSMTNLSEDDVGELTPHDAAGISAVIFQSMKKYMQLGKQIIKDIEDR